jgi:hypothetical protein
MADSTVPRSVLGLGGLLGLCCLGPTSAAVVGGTAAVGLGGGLVQVLVTVATLAVVGAVLRRRTDCSTCPD